MVGIVVTPLTEKPQLVMPVGAPALLVTRADQGVWKILGGKVVDVAVDVAVPMV